MKRTWHCGWLVFVGLLFAVGRAGAAVPGNQGKLQMLHAFCHPSNPCTEEEDAFGFGAQEIAAGSDGAYYGTTYNNDDDAVGGILYRYDPVSRDTRIVFQFPENIHPESWLKIDASGSFFGGYRHTDSDNRWQSGGFYRLSPAGEFTIINEIEDEDFVCNAPVQDSLGDWIGVTSTNFYSGKASVVYKMLADGTLQVLHTFETGKYSDCYDHGPVLAADGSLYGVLKSADDHNFSSEIFRITPDGSVAILHEFDDRTSYPNTSLTIGADGALYGVANTYVGPRGGAVRSALYRVSMDGQFTNLGAFGTINFYTRDLTSTSDGYLYGVGRTASGSGDHYTVFRLSPAGQYTGLYAYPDGNSTSVNELIRGFDDTLYGTNYYGGPRGGGWLLRYVPPPAPPFGSKRVH